MEGEPADLELSPGMEIREYRAGDEESVLACFNEVFAAEDPNFKPRQMSTWRWAFLQNPAGWRIFVAVVDGRVVAQCASLPMRMLVDGQPRSFSQGVDSMAHPDFRRGLKQPGLFVRTAWPYFAHYGGLEEGKDMVIFGLPIEQAWRVGKTFLKYEVVRELCTLERDRNAAVPPPTCAPHLHVVETDRVGDWIDNLWRPYRETQRCIAVRDAAYLNWRYADKPDHDYVFAIALERGQSDARGMAVYRRGSFSGTDAGMLVDWMVPAGATEVGNALLRWAIDRAEAEAAPRVSALLPAWDAWFEHFQAWGFRVRPTRYVLASRTFSKPHDMAWLRDHWYYTLGDFDLV